MKLLSPTLPRADHLLDLLGQRLGFLGPPHDMLLVPMAGFLLHEPALRDPTRFSAKVAVLARVVHPRSPPSIATLLESVERHLPRARGELNHKGAATAAPWEVSGDVFGGVCVVSGPGFRVLAMR